MSNKILNAAIAAPVALASLILVMATPAVADHVESTSCVGSRWSLSCVTRWRRSGDPNVILVAPPGEEQSGDSKEREQQWRERCRPTVQRDRYGVSRYTYAGPGCEFGSYR